MKVLCCDVRNFSDIATTFSWLQIKGITMLANITTTDYSTQSRGQPFLGASVNLIYHLPAIVEMHLIFIFRAHGILLSSALNIMPAYYQTGAVLAQCAHHYFFVLNN